MVFSILCSVITSHALEGASRIKNYQDQDLNVWQKPHFDSSKFFVFNKAEVGLQTKQLLKKINRA